LESIQNGKAIEVINVS